MKYYFADTDKRKIKKEIKIIIIKAEKTKKEEGISNNENIKMANINNNDIKEIPESISIKALVEETENKKFEKEINKELNLQNELGINEKGISERNLFNDNYKIKNNIQKKNKINKIENKFNPNNIQLLNNLTKDSYSDYTLDNTFTVFNSIDNIIYLIYTNIKKSIITYNIIDNKKINEIKNAHSRDITNLRHFLDKYNKRDLIISISLSNNNLKLWDITTFECLLNLENINKSGRLFSACLLSENNANYVITSCAYGNNEPIKIFDMNNIKVKEINELNDSIYFIESFYDTILSKYFIIVGCNGFIKSFDYNNNIIYKKYNDNDNNRHCSIIINNKGEKIKMLESSFDGNLRIWDFHKGILLKKIKICENSWLFGLCLWDNEHLLIGCGDKSIKVVELKNGTINANLNGFNNKVLCIKKVIHPLYGECLITQGYEKEQIKLFCKKI